MKKIIAIILALLCVAFCSCKKEEIKEEKELSVSHEAKKEEEKKEEKEQEEEIEVVYAKTPEAAADMCLNAFKSGDLYSARHYVTPDGKAFKELNELREDFLESFQVKGNQRLEEKAEKLVNNVLKHFNYTKTKSDIKGDKATITYSVSMPDMESINYSQYIESYMNAKGMTQEELMASLEGMNEAEIEAWSMEYSLDVMNYIFESGADFERETSVTVISVEKHKSGWLVSHIDND